MHIKQERTCVSCKRKNQEKDMIRIARINNQFIIDKDVKLGGRGAYICKDDACIQNCIKKKTLNRSFKCNVDNEIYIKLGEYEQNN